MGVSDPVMPTAVLDLNSKPATRTVIDSDAYIKTTFTKFKRLRTSFCNQRMAPAVTKKPSSRLANQPNETNHEWVAVVLRARCCGHVNCPPQMPAPVAKKIKPQSTFYKDAPFTKLQEKTCGLSALP